MEFSDQIKEIRHRLILSQKMLAEKLGVSFATVNRWEKGKTMPNYIAKRKIKTLCKKNNINFNEGESL